MSSANHSAEQWRPIPGYEGCYEASDRGRVRSVDRTIAYSNGRVRQHRGRVLSPRQQPWKPNQGEYLQVVLSKNRHRKTLRVHRLVLMAFIGPCPPGLEACHGNDIPDDNRLENLRWDTRKANRADWMERPHSPRRPGPRRDSCKRGHEFTPENTYLRPTGRECKACRVIHVRNFKARKAAA